MKGVVSLCANDEVFWTEDLIEETAQWSQDSYITLTLVESQMNDPLPEHVRRLKSNVQSLQRLLVSCETSASSAVQSKDGGSWTRKTGLKHNEGPNTIFAFYTFFMEKKPVASHKFINASKKGKCVRNM